MTATGGFLRDLEPVMTMRPELAHISLQYASFPGADGTGLQLSLDAGAAAKNIDAIGLYARGMAHPTTDGGYLAFAFACGELAGIAGGSLVGEYGFTGSLSAVVLSGRVAGKAAAEMAVTP